MNPEPSAAVLAERLAGKDELQRERVVHVRELMEQRLDCEARALVLASDNHNKALAMWISIVLAAISLLGALVVTFKHT